MTWKIKQKEKKQEARLKVWVHSTFNSLIESFAFPSARQNTISRLKNAKIINFGANSKRKLQDAHYVCDVHRNAIMTIACDKRQTWPPSLQTKAVQSFNNFNQHSQPLICSSHSDAPALKLTPKIIQSGTLNTIVTHKEKHPLPNKADRRISGETIAPDRDGINR